MSRYDLQSQTQPDSVADGDLHFTGLNMKLPREQLPMGTCSRLENKRLIHGAETRPGTRTPVFANLYPQTSFIGSGVYSNPNGFEIGGLATSTEVIQIRCGTVPSQIAVTGGFSSDHVELVQHFDKWLAHQSNANDPTYIWDGLNPDVGFLPITGPSVDEAGIAAIPNPPWSVNFLGRAWFPIPSLPDSIGASDINDPTTYDADLHTFRVNTGNADQIVGIYPYLSNNIIVAKDKSIDMMIDIAPDLGDAYFAALEIGLSPASPPPPQVVSISREIGVVARKSALLIGGRFTFMSQSGPGGIYQLVTDRTGNFIVDPTPVSDPIEPLIGRINWSYASGIVAALKGIYAKWFVPLDDCTYNNAALVLNVVTGQWEGVDLWNALPRNTSGGRVVTNDNPLRADNLLTLDNYGRKELFAVNEANGKVHLIDHGLDDQLEVAQAPHAAEHQTYPIQDLMETRGYDISDSKLQSENVKISMNTFAPSITVYQIIDGSYGDEGAIGNNPITRDRSKYETLQPDFQLTNANDDFEAPRREDYAIEMDDSCVLQDGIRIRRAWPWTQEYSLLDAGRYISFRITNALGLVQVRSIVFQSRQTRTQRALG